MTENMIGSCHHHDREEKDVLNMFQPGKTLKICAPMVRYSKLGFRILVRQYGCDLAFTPMIMANSFVRSSKARDSEFTTNTDDRPLIVQFAANNGKDLADAAEIVSPFSNGIDINCGCPQRWAIQEGVGACLINKPDLLSDMIRQVKHRVSDKNFSISMKIRVHPNKRKTVELCQMAEKVGINWITVHGRTIEQRNQPVDYEAIGLIKEHLNIPVVANGDICSMDDVDKIKAQINIDGVMAARGILHNPAMFAGYEYTPLQCIKDWVSVALRLGTPFQIFHHHLIDMLEFVLPRPEKRTFNCLSSTSSVLDFLDEHYGV